MNILKILFPCCLSPSHDEPMDKHINPASEKLIPYTNAASAFELQNTAKETSDELLYSIAATTSLHTSTTNIQVQEIFDSDKPSTITSVWWTQMILKRLYKAMTELAVSVEELREKLSPATRKVFDEAERFAHELEELQGEHPVLAVLIDTTALALLVILLAPFLLESLGFSVEGVVEGKCSFCTVDTSLIGNEQAVSPPDSSRCILMSHTVRCSQSCRVSPQDTEGIFARTRHWDRRTSSRNGGVLCFAD